ncbi:FimV/HubP family polar landmark protein [uncultured Pseudoteredinibacter sp.]|uniref:FimV/HubP family polar landmark protein n=1 Tax=uncultured Pseudoteredinibacter sp. TaxID=1641701 RepID=UPI00262BDBB9|nr:FimV/HubP family polar landmark protein [uncultured Pseudoteredinibacter sp.]
MRLGNLAVAIGLVTAMSSPGLSALGLGEITLHSTLNQPLDAEIKLLQTRDLDKGEILATLASSDDFKRAGIERNYFLTGLKFTVDLKAPGGPVLRVRSDRQVQEPYLNFLIETRWPAGRILREYTLLMDLPVFTEDAAPAVQAAKPAAPKPQNKVQRRPKPSEPVTRPVAEPEKPRTSVAQNDVESTSSYGPVGANETLWGIASQVRPSRGASIQQTMLAIQRLNPEAFIDGNINRLRRGQVLRIPTESEISRLTTRQAITEVAQQNTDWSGNANGDVGAPIDAASSRNRRNTSSEQASGRVSLASASETAGSASRGAGSGQAELSQALEQLDKSRRENDELKSRLADLEAQIETMERLVEVSSEQMRALQLAAEKGGATVADETGEGVIDPLNDAYKDSIESASQDSEKLAELVPDEQAADDRNTESTEVTAKPEPAKAKPAPKKKVAAVVSTPKAEPGIVDMLMENILYIGGALVAVLLAAWALLRRRKDDDEEAVEPELAAAAFDNQLEQSEEVSAEPEESDVLSEADVYIAYGKFDQAEALLQGHLSTQSDDSAARLKLLEVYSEAKNYTGFDEQADILDKTADDATLAKIANLRESMGGPDNASDALDALGLEISDEEKSLDDLQLDADADEFDLSDMDFSLDQDSDGLDSEGLDSGASEAQAEDGLGSIDGLEELNLDGGEENSNELSDIEFDLALGLDDAAEGDAVSLNEPEVEVDVELDASALEEEIDGLADIEFETAFDEPLESASEELENTASIVEEGAEESAEDALAALDDFSLEGDNEQLSAGLDDIDLDFSTPDLESTEASAEIDEPALQLDEKTAAVAAAGAAALGTTVVGSLTMHDETEADQEPATASVSDELAGVDGLTEADDFDLSLELDANTEDDLDLGADGELDLAELDKELDSELDLNEELDLDTELDLDSNATTELSDTEDFSSDFGEEAKDLDALAASDMDLPATDLSVGDLAGGAEDLGDDLAALDISLGDDPEINSELEEKPAEAASELSNELDFLADSDEVATKLDLARAYMDMGDKEGAKEILEEVVNEGDDGQQKDAQELIDRMS